MKLTKSLPVIFIIMIFFGCAKKDDSQNIAQSDVEAPSAPSGLTAQEAGSFINLSWARNLESDISKYRLYRSALTISNSPVADLSPVQKTGFTGQGYVEETGTFYADADVIMGSTYYYRVSAFDRDNNESRKSNQVVITYSDRIAPVKPAGLTALAGSKKGEINLSWTSNSESDLLCYKVYISGSGGNSYAYLATSGTKTYTVTGLTPGAQYYFFISAVDQSGNESGHSNVVFCMAKGDSVAPKMPAGLTALAGAAGTGRVNLSWTANTEPDLAKYNIYQSASGTGYNKIDEKIKPETTYIFYGLSSTYCYFRIKAVDDSDNESDYSGQVGITVP